MAIVAEPTTHGHDVTPETAPVPSTTAVPAADDRPAARRRLRPRSTPTTAAPSPPPLAAPAPSAAAPDHRRAPPTVPVYVAPQATDARLDSCTRAGRDATWRFSYVLSGGSGWRPIRHGDRRRWTSHEARTGLARDGFAVDVGPGRRRAGTVQTVALQPS